MKNCCVPKVPRKNVAELQVREKFGKPGHGSHGSQASLSLAHVGHGRRN